MADAQMYGWAHHNRASVLPPREQLHRADEIAARAEARLRGVMEVVYVRADYHVAFPKACMNGWGRRFMTVAPDGRVLPCPAATAISTLRFENVRVAPLDDIWYRSASFQAYRATAWMSEPCRSCSRRDVDFGGCRCQAFLLAGDASLTDHACSLSPSRGIVDAIVADATCSERGPLGRSPRNEPRAETSAKRPL